MTTDELISVAQLILDVAKAHVQGGRELAARLCLVRLRNLLKEKLGK